MTQIDASTVGIVSGILLLVFFFLGWKKGFLQELYSFVSIIISILAPFFLAKNMNWNWNGIEYFASFVIIIFEIRWIGKILNIVD